MKRKYLFLALAVLLGSILAVAALALPGLNSVSKSDSVPTKLPPGCVKPAGGFLIVTSQTGFNDSVDHGVPQSNWPVMNVRQGQNVTIVICNADPSQAHGFQIDHYYDSRLASIASGQVVTVTFVADRAGSFRVYCSIFCTVHWAMQNGELVVS